MTSEFVYANQTRKLKVSSLKPETLCKLFKLDIASLVLTDDEGGCYEVSGGVFDPALPDGRKFDVDGRDTIQNGIVASTQVVPRIGGELVVIHASQRDVSLI